MDVRQKDVYKRQGMDRVTRFNVIAMSGKAVEACGDVDTMILDKTGTITFGNRLAAEFYAVEGVSPVDLRHCAALASLQDDTPEGKSTLELARQQGWMPVSYTHLDVYKRQVRVWLWE